MRERERGGGSLIFSQKATLSSSVSVVLRARAFFLRELSHEGRREIVHTVSKSGSCYQARLERPLL